MASAVLNTVKGQSCRPQDFVIREFDTLDMAEVERVLDGTSIGCIFRNVIPLADCRRITANFWNHPGLRQRDDAVPAYYLGAYHYGKSLESYLEAVAASSHSLHEVFEGCRNLFDEVMGPLGERLASRGVALRPAAHGGREAGHFVMRSWTGRGEFALQPHEDAAQLSCRTQKGFEIQDVRSPLVAVNICLENSGGGELHYWNVQPSDETRASLGLEETGYPYPLSAVEDIERLVLPVRPGDIYFFDGRYVHAVASQDDPVSHRATISYLMGYKDPQTAIYWS